MTGMFLGAKSWMVERGFEVVFEKDSHTLIGQLREDLRFKPGSSQEFDIQEMALVVATETMIRTNIAQARLNALLPWKKRKAGRWVAVLVPREIASSDLLSLKDADQIVAWPTKVI